MIRIEKVVRKIRDLRDFYLKIAKVRKQIAEKGKASSPENTPSAPACAHKPKQHSFFRWEQSTPPLRQILLDCPEWDVIYSQFLMLHKVC